MNFLKMLTLVPILCVSISSHAEPLRYKTGLVVPENVQYQSFYMMQIGTDLDVTLPEKVDLREEGLVSPVQNQGGCGSCWAFAGTAVMESHMLAQGKTFNLSEQELVSCDSNSSGCSGGWDPFQYMTTKGQGEERFFPYLGRNAACKKIPSVGKAAGKGSLGQPNRSATVDEVRRYLATFKRPLWVSVSAGGSWNNPGAIKKSCGSGRVNHAVTIVGYEPASTAGKYNFIVKNSWGKTWNGDGFVKMPLGCDNLAQDVSFLSDSASICHVPTVAVPQQIKVSSGSAISAKDIVLWTVRATRSYERSELISLLLKQAIHR